MNERVERMFGARESWGRGNEREQVDRCRKGETPGGSAQDAMPKASPSPANGGGKGERIATAPAGPRNDTQAPGTAEGVKGFVSIRCGGCGKIVNTCLHERRTIFNCKSCEHPNRLEGLKSMKVECPRCGFRGLYKTNREESPIVMECLSCSQPVTLRRGKRRGNYVTIKERSE